jgi:general secretion pathway protein F
MATFFFRAVASDGKIRSGSLAGASEKLVARELRKQGLTPVYVGAQPNKGLATELKLPSFGGGKRRDVLFFTQELSTLLNSSVPLDRALAITSELTEKASFRAIVADVLRVLKGGRSLADSLATHPDYFSELYLNMVRAGEASGALAVIFERLAEFERTRDDLRNFIVSAMIYPALLATVGAASVFILLDFVVPRFAVIFQEGHMAMPTPTRVMLAASDLVRLRLDRAERRGGPRRRLAPLHQDPRRASVVGPGAPEAAVAWRCAAQSRNLAIRARHGYPGVELRSPGAVARNRRGHAQQQDHL